jgi:hypothetical protein
LTQDVARNHHDRDSTIADCLPDGDLQSAGHLVGSRNQLAIVAALFEQTLRMGFLEISGANLTRWDLRGNAKHWYPRAMAVEQPVDEVQIAGPAAASANGEFTGQMRFGAGREGCDLLVADVDPLNLGLSSQSVGKPVELSPTMP